jgi:hypothetical protein
VPPRPASRDGRGKRGSSPCARPSTSGPSSPCAPPCAARAARPPTASVQLFVELKHEQHHHHQVDRRDRRGPARHLEALRIRGKRVDEQLIRVLDALLPRWIEGAVSLSHAVCCAVVEVVRLMMGRGSRIVWSDCAIQRNAASRRSLKPRERRGIENSWTSSWMRVCRGVGASAFIFSA